ncbi:MAG: Fur family transcriptional regulator [Chitinophagales bacterium]
MDAKMIQQLLLDNGIKPSPYRMRIYQYLVEHRNHPNVDMIYQELVDELPTLSKTTLYNTLSLFLEKGITIPITIAENEMRYDADTSIHGHFQCKVCGKIDDLRLNMPSIQSLKNYMVTENHLYFKGICPGCQKSQPADS